MKWLLIPCLILGAFAAESNSSIRIRSSHDSQDPFEVILPGESSPPGIYAFIPGKKEPQFAVGGHVFGASRSFNGVLAQLQMTYQTKRYEMLAVVDGKITLFGINSTAEKKDSRIVLGENAPVVDVLSGERVKLEPINEDFIGNVNVITGPRAHGAMPELVLISIKQPNIHGSGLTIALVVSTQPGPIKLLVPPTVIDYSFLSSQALVKIPGPQVMQVISRSVLQRMSHPRRSDDRLLREYREFLKRAAQSIGREGTAKEGSGGPKHKDNPSFEIPIFDFAQGREVLYKLPEAVLMEKPLTITQRVDPISERAHFTVSQPIPSPSMSIGLTANAQPGPTVVQGRLDFDPQTGRYLARVLNQDPKASRERGQPTFVDGSPLVLVSVEGKPYLLMEGHLRNQYFQVDLHQAGIESEIFFAEPHGVHYVVTNNHTDPKQRSSTHYVILSSKAGRGKGSTRLLRITETFVGIASTKAVEIRKGHEDAARLARRMRIESWATELGASHVLFDDRTERFPEKKDSPSKAELAALEKLEQTPFLDLTAYSGNGIRIPRSYSKAEVVEILKVPQLEFVQYQPLSGKISTATGLYARGILAMGIQRPLDVFPEDAQSLKDQYLQGLPLRPSDFRAKKNAKSESGEPDRILELKQKVETGVSNPSTVGISIIPMLSVDQVERGLKQMRLAIATHGEVPGDSIQTQLYSVTVPIAHSDFLSAKFIVGRRNHKQSLHLLVFHRTSEQDGRQTGGILLYSNLIGRLETVATAQSAGQQVTRQRYRITGSNSALEDVPPITLYRGEVTESLLKSRIVYDAEGRPLWIATPDLEQTDPKFQAMYLVDPSKKTFVNLGFSGIRLRFDEVLDDSTDLSLGGGSKWALLDRSAVLNRVPGLAQYVENRRKEVEQYHKANQKEGGPIRREEQTFADFNKYLDELADPKANEAKHRVLLVSKEMLPLIRNMMMNRLLQRPDSNEGGPFSMMNPEFYLYLFDPAYTPRETKAELQKIGLRKTKAELLVADMENIIAIEAAHPPESKEDPKTASQDSSEASFGADPAEEGPEAAGTSNSSTSAQSEVAKTEGLTKVTTDGPEAGETPESERFQFPYTRLAYLAAEGEPLGHRLPSFYGKTKRLNTLVLATPEQWRDYARLFPKERKAGVFDSFELDAKFLTSSWTVWPPKSSRATKETADLSRASISRDEYQVFESLDRLLTELATPSASAQHQILVVPDEIKPLVNRLIATRWATEHRDLAEGWNHRNKTLALYQLLPSAASQEDVFDNYASLKGSLASRRPVLLADMADVIRAARVQAHAPQNSYRLRDPVVASTPRESILGSVNSEDSEQNSESEMERTQVPHLIWWMASEGQKIQPRRAKGWKLRDDIMPSVPTLIVATEKELQTLEQDAAFESRFFTIREAFQVTNLEKPSEVRRRALIEDLFRRPEVATLQYRFKKDNLENEDARRQLIGLLVGRVEQISSQLGLEPTYAFLKIYSALKKALTEDIELRRNREIDSPYLSRLFAKVFPLPLNWEILRTDDPLQKLRDPVQAARGLQEAGYEGATELKVRAVQALTSHTRGGSDKGRKIPSSVVLIGDKGTGKTFIVETLIKYLGLKLYNFNKPHDEEAGAIIIRVMDLIEKDDPAHPHKMSVDAALAHVSNFLSLPNGWRGLVLFDDLHKAGSTEILRKLMTFIQTMHEAEGGILRVQRLPTDARKVGEIKEIPSRNIMEVVTLNPTKDLKKRERFFEKWDNKKDPVREAVAALTREGYEIEDSIFSRFGDVIDLSEFPRDAKVPSLLGDLRAANQSEFTSNPRLMLVTPETLDGLVNSFPDANARDFISPATNALMNLSFDLPRAPIYLVEPQASIDERGFTLELDTRPVEAWRHEKTLKVEPGKIEAALRNKTSVFSITPKDPLSQIHLLGYLAENFRAQIMNALVIAAQADHRISGTHEARATQLFSLLTSVMGHLSVSKRLPLGYFDIRPQHLGIQDPALIRELQKRVREHPSNRYTPLIHVPSQTRNDEVVSLGAFFGRDDGSTIERSRLDLMTETSKELQTILEQSLSIALRVRSLSDLKRPMDWVSEMPASDPKEEFQRSTQRIIDVYVKFAKELYDRDLAEMRDSSKYRSMQFYDQYRLFWLTLDAAMMRLPWPYLTNFVLNGVDLAVSDLAIGQLAGIQHFIFKSQVSPLTTATHESVILNIRGAGPLRDTKPEQLQRYHDGFVRDCSMFLKLIVDEVRP